MPDLIDLDRARQGIPSSVNTDEPVISTLITAASRAVQRYCKRDFVLTSYDELCNGNGKRELFLRQYPIVSVQSVRYRPVTVLKIINNLINTPQARVSVTSTGLTLLAVTNGVPLTLTVNFIGNPTLSALATAINALGNGWSAQSQGYDSWPSVDLRAPQGALTAAGQFAELKLHTYELAGYQINDKRGWLLRAIPYSDPELLHPEDLIWPTGINNFRVQYTAGYATVPEDVQEACAELTATWFRQLGRDLSLHAEKTPDYQFIKEAVKKSYLPDNIRVLLAPYRNHRIINTEG